MPRTCAGLFCLALTFIALAGCAPAPFYETGFAEQPPEYSADYAYVPIIDPDQPCCVERWVLAPEACLAPDVTEPLLFGPHLPPACANNYNLMRMAERPHDLRAGRRLGAAPAAPSARAAQLYIYGGNGPLGGGLAAPGAAPPPSDSAKEKSTGGGAVQ